jgi:hypothetical protein
MGQIGVCQNEAWQVLDLFEGLPKLSKHEITATVNE